MELTGELNGEALMSWLSEYLNTQTYSSALAGIVKQEILMFPFEDADLNGF